MRTNNHKVTCTDCINVQSHVFYEDGLPFRYDETCKLGYETDYRIPYETEWDCKHYSEWTLFKVIKNKIKELL